MPIGMRSHHSRLPSLLNGSIFADKVVVANACPFVGLLVELVYVCSCGVLVNIWKSRMMDDQILRGFAFLVFGESEEALVNHGLPARCRLQQLLSVTQHDAQ